MTAIAPLASMAPGRPKRCLLVLGMHNSGTSLLSNLMHGAGVPLGPHLLLRDRMPEHGDRGTTTTKTPTSLSFGIKRCWICNGTGAAIALPGRCPPPTTPAASTSANNSSS